MEPLVPQVIGESERLILDDRYVIQSLLGKKTGRRTYLAQDSQTGNRVVIKLMLFGPDFVWDDLKLFEREAEILRILEHSAIPRYLESFEIETKIGKGFALVQTYIEARSLQDWVESGRTFSEDELKAIATELLDILAYLHQRSPAVIHRDIKPSNILLGSRSGHSLGSVYLVDFGSVQTAITPGTFTVVGTYGYMAPEQYGGNTSPASDLYSLGATLVYLITGTCPSHLPMRNGRAQFKATSSLTPTFQRWIQCLLEADKTLRFSTALMALKALQDPQWAGFFASSLLSQPQGSRVKLQKSEDQLKLVIPAMSFKNKCRYLATQLILTVFLSLPLFLLLWRIELAVLLIPYELAILILNLKEWHSHLFESIQLLLTSERFELTHRGILFQNQQSFKANEISKLEFIDVSPTYSSSLNIWIGNYCVPLAKPYRRGSGGRLSSLEIEWIALELSEWLDLPLISGIKPGLNINSSLLYAQHQMAFAKESKPKFDLVGNPPRHTVCQVYKSGNEMKISAPVAPKKPTPIWIALFLGAFICLFSQLFIPFWCIFTLLSILILYERNYDQNQPCQDQLDRVELLINDTHILLWRKGKPFTHIQKVERSQINKILLVHKENNVIQYHITLTSQYPCYCEQDILVGNRTYWLSRHEAEWLAYELSRYLNLPITVIAQRG